MAKAFCSLARASQSQHDPRPGARHAWTEIAFAVCGRPAAVGVDEIALRIGRHVHALHVATAGLAARLDVDASLEQKIEAIPVARAA